MNERDDADYDLVVLGSGIAGLTAALTAAVEGLRVVVLEKEALFGGTSAYSEAMVWVPRSRQALALGIDDRADEAVRYARAAARGRSDASSISAYVDSAATALEFIERHSGVRYELTRGSIDYHPELPGASAGWRALTPLPFDGRRLGARFAELRAPLATTMIFGGMSITGPDLRHFYAVGRSLRSTAVVARLFGRYLIDRLRGNSRGTVLTGGNGVVAALMHAVLERGVPLRTGVAAVALERDERGVTGVRLRINDCDRVLRARAGVVLACGGYSHDADLTRRTHPHVAAGKTHHSLAAPGATGDGLRLALGAGAVLRTDLQQPAAWTPTSLVPVGGARVPFPHFGDRCKPGFIAVDRRGRRFANEALSYHEFVPAMIEACREDPSVEVYLICDHAAQRRHGIGVAPPFPGRIGPHVASGYLVTAGSIGALADQLCIPRAALEETVANFNLDATRGEDPQFGKGGGPYQRANGDPSHQPNPNVAPLLNAPYYAVRLVIGDIGTFAGLAADADARVLGAGGTAIEGLYAAGNDLASIMGGAYPAAGISVGPAMTFAWRAGRHAAQRLRSSVTTMAGEST
jgi:succinate dehydrogenase/fumarate reductase flavoprotein subunit